MASSIMYSSSLFVIIITGVEDLNSFISESVSKPESPGIFSSKKTTSKAVSLYKSIASCPLLQVVTV